MLGIKTDKIVIVGCGRLGASLAGALSERGENVVVIDRDSVSFRRLPPRYSGFQVEGDGTDPDTYWQARLQKDDTLFAVTESDNVNCMIAEMASRIYKLPRVVARLSDSTKERILEGFGIVTINPVNLSMDAFLANIGCAPGKAGGSN